MADRSGIKGHYDSGVGALHYIRFLHDGVKFPDYSCAFFNGYNFLSLTQAQKAKHQWIFKQFGWGPDLTGKRLLDIGCGWGPILNAVRERGGEAVGLTLAKGQQNWCVRHGLDAHLLNYLDYLDHFPDDEGSFDGIVTIGAPEHFCSVNQFLDGEQENVYRHFFDICHRLLKPGGKLYFQTMTWGNEVADPNRIWNEADVNGSNDIDLLYRLNHFYPDSFLPTGRGQLIECASNWFAHDLSSNGRLDYLQTLKGWDAATKNIWEPEVLHLTIPALIRLGLNYVRSQQIRIQWKALKHGDQGECFRRLIMDHWRIFFSKKN